MASPALFVQAQLSAITPAGNITINGSTVANKWTATMGVFTQTHSDPTTVPANQYDGTNIAVGDYFCNTASGASYKIVALGTKTASSVAVTLEDVDGVIAKSDNTGSFDSTPLGGAANKGYVFRVKNGLPVLNGIPAVLPGNLPVVFLSNVSGFFAENVFTGGGGSSSIGPQNVSGVVYTDGKVTQYTMSGVTYNLTYTATSVTIVGGGKTRTITYDGLGNLVSDVTA